jgi:hypothetical protein
MNVIRGELAFEQPEEQLAEIQVEEAEAVDVGAKAKSRNIGARHDKSWSTKSEPPASIKLGCTAAWSV